MSTDGMVEILFVMTNYDGSVPEGMAEALKARPAQVYGRHAGWNFSGRVWFADDQFHEEVRQHRVVVGTASAPSLNELMKIVNDQYGWD